MGKLALTGVGVCFPIITLITAFTFVALGKAKKVLFFSLFRKAMIVVPLTILLPKTGGLGVNGVFWAEPVSNLAGGCACFITMLLTVLPELKEEKIRLIAMEAYEKWENYRKGGRKLCHLLILR